MAQYYKNIVDLPLTRYIDVAVNDNLSALTIEGFPTELQLLEAWTEIRSQYADAMGDVEHRMYLRLLKDVTILSADYETIQKLAHFLLGFHCETFLRHAEVNKDIFDEVHAIALQINKILHTSFKFDPYIPEEFRNELKRSLNQSKALKIRLDMKKIEFDVIRKGHESAEPPTKEYFHGILITLSDHAKLPLNDSISVYEFCERVQRYNYYLSQKQKNTQ